MSARATVTVEVVAPSWRKAAPQCRALTLRCARAARATAPGMVGAIAIQLADDATLRTLNRTFRGQDKPTNVLSFPADAGDGTQLGDIAIAFGVARAEARAGGVRFADHLSHLVIHGVLHLLGHDHDRDDAAMRMQRLEARLLARFKIANPYAPRARRAA
jgi:probable rRNA maturation factor